MPNHATQKLTISTQETFVKSHMVGWQCTMKDIQSVKNLSNNRKMFSREMEEYYDMMQ